MNPDLKASPPLRSLFLGHGAPTLAISHHPAAAFLADLGRALPRPAAVIVISPHWMTRGFAVKSAPRLSAWHDFGGFDAALYELRYAPPGEDALALRVLGAVADAGLPTARVEDERIDHGVWVPLMRMWPQADVPVVQISLASAAGPAGHWALGEALRPLLADGVLLIGSGSLVHNLRDLNSDEDAPPVAWSVDFDHWMEDRLLAGDRAALLDYRKQAPQAVRAHPSDEHLLPLFTAAAAGDRAQKLQESFTYGSLSMSAFGFS